MTERTVPRRRWRMTLDLQADTLDDMMGELERIAHRLAEAGAKGQSGVCVTSSGYSSGFVLDVDEDPTMDHGRYAVALEDYLRSEGDGE